MQTSLVFYKYAKLPFCQLHQFITPQAITRGSFPFILNKTASYQFLRIFAVWMGLIYLSFFYICFSKLLSLNNFHMGHLYVGNKHHSSDDFASILPPLIFIASLKLS